MGAGTFKFSEHLVSAHYICSKGRHQANTVGTECTGKSGGWGDGGLGSLFPDDPGHSIKSIELHLKAEKHGFGFIWPCRTPALL